MNILTLLFHLVHFINPCYLSSPNHSSLPCSTDLRYSSWKITPPAYRSINSIQGVSIWQKGGNCGISNRIHTQNCKNVGMTVPFSSTILLISFPYNHPFTYLSSYQSMDPPVSPFEYPFNSELFCANLRINKYRSINTVLCFFFHFCSVQ